MATSLRKYKTVLLNEKGERLTLILPAENRPPWRQPYDVADDYANNIHPEYRRTGPWTVYSTDVSA